MELAHGLTIVLDMLEHMRAQEHVHGTIGIRAVRDVDAVVHVVAHQVRASVFDQPMPLDHAVERMRRSKLDQAVAPLWIERAERAVEIERGQPLAVVGVAGRA